MKKMLLLFTLVGAALFFNFSLTFGQENESKVNLELFNAKIPLQIDTYEHSGQLTHPDIVYSEKGWNSYKYWMVFTPYPNENIKYSNPSLRASNDGVHWRKPWPLLPDPVVASPKDRKRGGFNSDPDIELAGETMYLFYRYTTAQNVTTIWFRTSTDGRHWNPARLTNLPSTAISPAYYYDGKVFHCWFVEYTGISHEHYAIYYTTSENGVHWSPPTKTILLMHGYVPWHLNVTKTVEGYEMLLTAYPLDGNSGQTVLFHAWSLDRLHWVLSSQKPLLKPVAGAWDSKQIYRSAMIKDAEGYKIWYSAADHEDRWRIGLTTLRTIPSDSNQTNLSLMKNELNARVPLRISTYDHFNQANHPDVVYVEKGWNSFKYWMVFTPYVDGMSKYENPSIRASNDGVHWVDPSPHLQDPVVNAPADSKEGGFNSDPDMELVGETMYLFYRTTTAHHETTIYLKTSSDGVKWSSSQKTNLPSTTASPAFYYDGKMFHCWYVEFSGYSREPFAIKYSTSINGLEWSQPVSAVLPMSGFTPWHINVIKTEQHYEMLLTAYPLNGTSAQTVLFHAWSLDKIHWMLSGQKPFLKPILGSWDSKQIYRSAMIKDANGYKIWYSAADSQNNWHIGFITLKTIPYDKDYPIKGNTSQGWTVFGKSDTNHKY